MKQLLFLLTSLLFTVFIPDASAQPPSPTSWTVGGEKREAIVVLPTRATEHPPVVFVFHGHGGTMRAMERRNFQKFWPEAIVVYPQGLPSVTRTDPQGDRAGWQNRQGVNKDRDLKFVDAMLKTLREEHKIDEKRVCATGHSNGGGFTYLLWAARGKELAAVAPSAAGAVVPLISKDARPIPVMHVAGQADQTVPFVNQERTITAIRERFQCEPVGKPWAKAGSLVGTIYSSKAGPPFVTLIHQGTHVFPAEAPELIMKFFRESSAR